MEWIDKKVKFGSGNKIPNISQTLALPDLYLFLFQSWRSYTYVAMRYCVFLQHDSGQVSCMPKCEVDYLR